MAVISHGKNSVYTILKSKFGSNVSTELEKEMSTRLLFNTQKILFEPRFFPLNKLLKNLKKISKIYEYIDVIRRKESSLAPQFSLQPILIQTSDKIDEVSFGKCQLAFVLNLEIVEGTTTRLL